MECRDGPFHVSVSEMHPPSFHRVVFLHEDGKKEEEEKKWFSLVQPVLMLLLPSVRMANARVAIVTTLLHDEVNDWNALYDVENRRESQAFVYTANRTHTHTDTHTRWAHTHTYTGKQHRIAAQRQCFAVVWKNHYGAAHRADTHIFGPHQNRAHRK